MFVVFVEMDGLEGDFGDEGFQVGWEFALVLP
jgi:hypothetical protein